ncbi:MAG: monofunctional biosynthetic peptidoglycan transglycosylase [Roseitalea sp.]|jgi:monofunctional biosynthetic peptidoglycan transglycosylase|nr:monofunctional biosynthetic peptidoglycan transglycosylase [Roseitalea sp.]MBO6720902.1 monofunctional biosynthetic peptidoglycan transglycosylase [Roseitalea sp.]MBO6743207.1 monofunctional biosynthetic peptidoglycan transglycosylase [Roseitalea sp.]
MQPSSRNHDQVSRAKTTSKASGGASRGAAKASGAGKGRAGGKRRISLLRRRWIRYPLLALLILATVPFVLTLVYRIDAVRPVSTLMLSRMVTLQPVDRQWVEIDHVAPRLYQSVMMSEDGQFCSHHGIDLRELRAVIDDALEGERVRGASTITMQTAKNLFLWNGRSLIRKGLEVPLAIWIDLVLPKQRIMEIYLNIAEWGPSGQFGIKAGAAHHFGRAPDGLNNRQSALLAVTLPNPHVRDPARPGAGMQRVADIVQRRAAQSGDYVRCLSR